MSNESKILSLLKAGRVLTVKTCWKRLGTTELRVFIARLRKKRVPIESTWQSKGGKRWCAYWMHS